MRGNTQKNAYNFADFRLARYARGVEERQEQKDKRTYSTTKNSREGENRLIDKKQQGIRSKANKKSR